MFLNEVNFQAAIEFIPSTRRNFGSNLIAYFFDVRHQ